MKRAGHALGKTEALLTPREAALQLRISFPTIKQWIYKKKIRSVRTPRRAPSHSANGSGPVAVSHQGPE